MIDNAPYHFIFDAIISMHQDIAETYYGAAFRNTRGNCRIEFCQTIQSLPYGNKLSLNRGTANGVRGILGEIFPGSELENKEAGFADIE